MKRFVIFALASLSVLAVLTDCTGRFDNINTNPDSTTNVTPDLLSYGILLHLTQTGPNNYFVYDDMLCKFLAWGGGIENYVYNNISRFDNYITLPLDYSDIVNARKMVEAAPEKEKDAYEALAHFVKAYNCFYMSMEMGDIPYEEAAKGEEGVLTPKYNTQKEVMQFVLSDLGEAYRLFSVATNFSGDPILGGDVGKWKKIVTAFELKVLMNLSRKEDDPDLNVREKFASIVSSQPLMESNDDNFQLVYADKAATVYPFHNTQTGQAMYAMISTTLVDTLKKYQDPRLFYYAKPAQSKLAQHIAADSWDAYIGTDPSSPYDEVRQKYSNNDFCSLSARYTDNPAGEPLIRIGYSEQNFLLAEAVLRGWISGDANYYYKKGIRGNLDFLTEHTPAGNDSLYVNNRPLTDAVKADIVNNPEIQLGKGFERDLNLTMTQKYLSSFLQYPYEPYYDYRRTGYPRLPVNPETNLNAGAPDKIPMRWMYPESESQYNKTNLEEALERQYDGNDDVNCLMWILQRP